MSRETLASIVHYVRNELNLGNAKDRELANQDEETTDYTLTEGEGETTYTGTNTGMNLIPL